MKVGYREFYKYFSISVFMGCGYLMLNFWEEGKGQISSYNMQDKALMILWFMIYTFGVAYGIINALKYSSDRDTLRVECKSAVFHADFLLLRLSRFGNSTGSDASS